MKKANIYQVYVKDNSVKEGMAGVTGKKEGKKSYNKKTLEVTLSLLESKSNKLWHSISGSIYVQKVLKRRMIYRNNW